MKSHKDLPDILELKDGKSILIKGFILEAQNEREKDVSDNLAYRLMTEVSRLCIAVSSKDVLNKWVDDYNRERK